MKYIDEGGVVRCSDLNTVDAATMIGSSPIADDKMSSTSSRRHRIRHSMEAREAASQRKKIAEGDEDDQWTRLIKK